MLITKLVVSFCKVGTTASSNFTERNDQRDKQHYSREFLMMGVVVPETC